MKAFLYILMTLASPLLPVMAQGAEKAMPEDRKIEKSGDKKTPSPKDAREEKRSKASASARSGMEGLSMLPAGSEVKGILLPRYEGNRISTVIKIGMLQIVSASLVEVHDFFAILYDDAGNVTHIKTPFGQYDLANYRVSSQEEIMMEDPRFQAKGSELHLDTLHKQGVLLGPVRTTIPASQNYSQ